MVGCFVANIGGAWMGGPANIGQFIATILYSIFWGVFTIMTRKYGVLVKVSFILSLLTFIGAFNSLVMRLLSEGHSIKEIASIMDFSSPYYLSYFFKRETGMTAREYLKKNVKSDDEKDRQTTDPMEVQL